MTYRDDLGALEARRAALDAQVSDLTRDRDETAQALAEAKARAKLPVLEDIRTAAPCGEAWENMTGDERMRSCASCKLQVFNLSAMTRDEAQELIAARAGRLCARYFRRADGTILTADCPRGHRKRQRRRLLAALGAAAALVTTGTAAMLARPHPLRLDGEAIRFAALREQIAELSNKADARGDWTVGVLDINH